MSESFHHLLPPHPPSSDTHGPIKKRTMVDNGPHTTSEEESSSSSSGSSPVLTNPTALMDIRDDPSCLFSQTVAVDNTAEIQFTNGNLAVMTNIQNNFKTNPTTVDEQTYHESIVHSLNNDHNTSKPCSSSSSSSQKKKKSITKKKKTPSKSTNHQQDEDEDIPSLEEIRYVKFLTQAEETMSSLTSMCNSYDFKDILQFHKDHFDQTECNLITSVSLVTEATLPGEEYSTVLAYRNVKGYEAIASYSATSMLTIPDGTNSFRNISLIMSSANDTIYEKKDIVPQVNPTTQIDETNYGYVIHADYFTMGTKIYEIEVVEEESLIDNQDAMVDAVMSLQSLSGLKCQTVAKADEENEESPLATATSTVSYTNITKPVTSTTAPTSVAQSAAGNKETSVVPVQDIFKSQNYTNTKIAVTQQELPSLPSKEKTFIAKSIEGMSVFVSTDTARFRRGNKLINPIKIALKGRVEVHITPQNKIRKLAYKIIHEM